MSLASNSSFSTSPECVAILFMLVIHVCQSCKGKDFISNSQAKRTPFCRIGENLQALLLQNAKCKMQRSECRAESSLSGYAERRMLSTKSNAKERAQSIESHSNAMPSDACSRRKSNAKERAQSRKLAFGLCRATHALDEVKCKGARAEPKARSPAAHLGKRCKVTSLEMRAERKIRRVKVW